MNIDKYLKKNKNKFLSELADYIKIKSVATNKKEVNEIVLKISKKLKKLKAKVKIVNLNQSNPFILAELGEGKKTLLIYDHYDVMSEGDLENWSTPPFELTEKSGILYGRGLADNKGHLILRMQAIESVLDIYKKLPIKIKFVIEGEEEIGSPHIHQFSDKFSTFLRQSNLCLWESGDVDEKESPQMFLGMKGIAYFLLSCQLGRNDLHSGYASLVDSAVWRLVLALNSLRDKNGNVLIPDLIKKIKPPSNFEVNLIKKNSISKKDLLNSLGRRNFLKKNDNKNILEILTNHYYGVTCNICGIWSGSIDKKEIKTVLPNQAFAKIDFRLVKNIDSKKVLSYLKKHLNKNGFSDIDVKELINEPVAYTDYKNKYFQKALEIISSSYKKKVFIAPYAKGSGPMYYIASRFNVPCIQLGAQTISSNIHGPNENITTSNYFKALKATINLITKL